MTALFRDLMRLGEAPPPAVDVEAAGLLMLMLAPLFAARGPTVSVAAAGAPDRMLSDGLRRAIDYVGRLYDQPVSVKTIARDTWQNPEQLSRRFRRELDMTPTEFLTLYRIEQAKLMLEDTNKPVAQVAHSVGFPDENYFIRQFTKVAGQTPRHYRSDRRSHPSS
jgi:AraC-like DNA-binding protein